MSNKHYFTSDYHLSHQNVIKYDNRPFKYAFGEMDEYIIDKQNKTVQKGDNFYFLGDFCFDLKYTEMYLARLTGNLFFIKGNHDRRDTIKLYEKYGVYLGEQKGIKVNDQHIILNHYSMNVWNRSHHGSWHLFGHSHGSLPDNKYSLSIDVGCMLYDYTPLEFEEIKEIMSKKIFKPIDHYGANGVIR